MVEHVGNDATLLAREGPGAEPDQLVVVELVRVLGRGQLGRVHHQQSAAQFLRRGPVTASGEGQEQPPGVPTRPRDGQRAASCGLRRQDGTRSEPAVRIIGPDLHGQLTADTVRPAYAADD